MATTQEILELILRTQGIPELEGLLKKLQENLALQNQLNDAYQRGAVQSGVYQTELATLTKAQNGLVNAIQGSQKSLGQADEAASKTGKSLMLMNRAMQQGAYAIGDFMSTSGGWGQRLNSVANNVQFVGAAFGGWGIAAGLAVQGIATAVTYYERSAKSVTNTLPALAGGVKGLTGQLEGLNRQIQELEKHGGTGAKETAAYLKLLGQQADLEKKIADEKQRQADIKKLLELRPETEIKEESERARRLAETLAGKQGEVVAGVEAALPQEGLEALKAQRRAAFAQYKIEKPKESELADTLAEEIRGIDKKINEYLVEHKKKAQEIVAKAIVKGEADAALQVEQMIGRQPEAFPKEAAKALAEVHEGFLDRERSDKERFEEAREYNKEVDALETEQWNAHIQKLNGARKIHAEQTRHQIEEQIKRENVLIAGAGGLQERAGARMAELKAMMAGQGFVPDKFGRQQRMTDQDIFQQVQREVNQELRNQKFAEIRQQGGIRDEQGRFHRMNERQAMAEANRQMNADLGIVVAARAQQDIGNKMTALSASGLTNMDKLLTITNSLMNQVQDLQVKTGQQTRVIDSLQSKDRNGRQRGNRPG